MIFEHIPNVVLINTKATKKNVDFAGFCVKTKKKLMKKGLK